MLQYNALIIFFVAWRLWNMKVFMLASKPKLTVIKHWFENRKLDRKCMETFYIERAWVKGKVFLFQEFCHEAIAGKGLVYGPAG